MTMTSNKPYLLRAIYDWIVDNELTPYILVNTAHPGVEVPTDYINGDRIILNISPKSCRGLHLDNDRVVFTARFSGQTMQVSMHPGSILAIYAKENGRGMEFGESYDPPPSDDEATPDSTSTRRARGKPSLKLVE